MFFNEIINKTRIAHVFLAFLPNAKQNQEKYIMKEKERKLIAKFRISTDYCILKKQ